MSTTIYQKGVKWSFPKLKEQEITKLTSIVNRFVKTIFTGNNQESRIVFDLMLEKNQYKDVLGVLKIFVPQSIIARRRSIRIIDNILMEQISREEEMFYTRTCYKYLNRMFVNWIDIIPVSSSRNDPKHLMKTKTMIKLDKRLITRNSNPQSYYIKTAKEIAKQNLKDVSEDCLYALIGAKYSEAFNGMEGYINKDEYLNIHAERFQPWYTFYGLHWLCQLQLFHKYEMNQVLLISGDTGVGKTSQIPKLILHAKEVNRYLLNLKGAYVSISVPRLIPAKDTTERTRSSLGFADDNTSVIQSRTGDVDDKSKPNKYNVWVKTIYEIYTDKKLLMELQQELIKLKAIDRVSKKSLETRDVIVDESHEHNPNMDLIITYCHYMIERKIGPWEDPEYNKLIIMTATMESDIEKLEKYFQLKKHLYDYAFHIEDPQNETRHQIIESYHPYPIQNDKLVEETVMKFDQILLDMKQQRLDSGVILCFMPTQALIDQTIIDIAKKYNNEIFLPLPLFRNVESELQEIIKNDDIKDISLEQITYYKSTVLDYRKFNKDKIQWKLIIASNIAEASITINNLKIVIETLFENRLTYNQDLDTNFATLCKISNSSRLQRRGRVGRTSDGFAYYMYPEGYLDDSQIIPNITYENIGFEVLIEMVKYIKITSDDKLLENNPDKNPIFYIHPGSEYLKNCLKILKLTNALDGNLQSTQFFHYLENRNVQISELLQKNYKLQHISIIDEILLFNAYKYDLLDDFLAFVIYLYNLHSTKRNLYKTIIRQSSLMIENEVEILILSPIVQNHKWETNFIKLKKEYQQIFGDLIKYSPEPIIQYSNLYTQVLVDTYPNKIYYRNYDSNNDTYVNSVTKNFISKINPRTSKPFGVSYHNKANKKSSKFFALFVEENGNNLHFRATIPL